LSVDLTPIQKTALVALAHECEWSLSAHPPEESVIRNVPTHLRGDVRKALNQLRRIGLVQKHPTGRNVTWNITQAGLTLARQ